MSCSNNMRQVGLAFANYHAAYNRYPSPDFGGHSWRVRTLPFMQSSPVYSEYRFDETWDSDANLSLDVRPLEAKGGNMVVFAGPYGPPCGTDAIHAPAYLMIVGDHAFGATQRFRDETEITDGLDCTIAAAETSSVNQHWLSSQDFDLATMSMRVNDGDHSISSNHPSGPAVLFCDWMVFRLNPMIDPDTLHALLTVDGGEPISRDGLVASGMLILP
ncbi:DUF1559 domain-containing protein [Neorhodopirellula lusitana]|nr:DUF1559 domain-containing protein [Neorhodopirellula lusitana]